LEFFTNTRNFQPTSNENDLMLFIGIFFSNLKNSWQNQCKWLCSDTDKTIDNVSEKTKLMF